MSQPRALYYLFGTELWERFGFYIVQGLLVLFVTQHFSYSDEQSYLLLGEFTALVYISPILGGFVGDRLLGIRPTILLGILFLGAGYFLLSSLKHEWLSLGLALVVSGNGLLKPNISSFLGRFYKKGDPKREAGYTIFYMGINIGIILSTLSSGWIVNELGWFVVFLLAGIGMVFALYIFLMGHRHFMHHGVAIKAKDIPNKFNRFLANRFMIFIMLMLATGLFYVLLTSEAAVYVQTFLAAIIVTLFIVAILRCQKQERYNLIIVGLLLLISVVFWALYFQLFLSFTLFIDRVVNRQIWGFEVPVVTFTSLESFFVLALGIFFSRLWQYISVRRRNPTYIIKFGSAIFFVAIAMGLLILAIQVTTKTALINPLWVVFIYLFITLGEMMLYPIGMAMVTVLVPKKLTGLMMGVWFMSLGYGGMLAGELARIADVPKHTSNIVTLKHIYQHAFSVYAMIALIAVCAILFLYLLFSKLGIKAKPV